MSERQQKSTLETMSMRDEPLTLHGYTVEEVIGIMLRTPPIKDKELIRWVRQKKMPKVDGDALLRLVQKLVPRNLPEDVREEIESEVSLAILSGDYSFRNLSTIKYADFRAKVYKMLPDKFRHVSIDAPLNEEGLTLADVLAAPAAASTSEGEGE